MNEVWEKIFEEGGPGMLTFICIDNEKIHAPEAILLLRCPFIKVMMEIGLKESTERIIKIPYKWYHLKVVLTYLCINEFIIPKGYEDAFMIMDLARSWNIQPIIQHYIEQLSLEASEINVFELLRLARINQFEVFEEFLMPQIIDIILVGNRSIVKKCVVIDSLIAEIDPDQAVAILRFMFKSKIDVIKK